MSSYLSVSCPSFFFIFFRSTTLLSPKSASFAMRFPGVAAGDEAGWGGGGGGGWAQGQGHWRATTKGKIVHKQTDKGRGLGRVCSALTV